METFGPGAGNRFPVTVPYEIRADLRKLEAMEGHFDIDEGWPAYLERKLDVLGSDPARSRVLHLCGPGDQAGGDGGPARSRLEESLWRVADLVASEHPQRFELRAGVFRDRLLGYGIAADGSLQRCRQTLPPSTPAALRERLLPLRERLLSHLGPLQPGIERLADALALSVQEDLVLISGPVGADRAQLLHVCFPSHWDPGSRSGASFMELHAPVPENARLLQASRNLVAAMLEKGPFVRHVWSLSGSADLDAHPLRVAPPELKPPLLPDMYFRSERQTTRALGEHALFTIRIYVSPLLEVLDGDRARLLARSIRSMSEGLARYKGLDGSRGERLVAELEEFGAHSRSTSSVP